MDTPTQKPATKRPAPKRRGQRSRGRAVAATIGRPSWFLMKLLLPFVILAGLGVGITYVRLLNGPIALTFLASPISRSIAAELPGISVSIEDALVRLTDSGSVEFRLRNVRFNDADGAPIAVAPLAAIGMSSAALRSARIAPDKIVLIEPRLLLVYSEQGGISVSFAKSNAAEAAPDAIAADDAISVLQRVDVAGLIAQAGQRARRGSDAASFLRSIGVRNATVILDRGGRQTLWTVIEGDIDLEHKKKRSMVSGALTLASSSGPWGLSFKIEEAEKANSVSLEATLRDLVPRALAPMMPDVPGLDILDAALNGSAMVELSPEGRVLQAGMKLDLGRGAMVFPGVENVPVPIESGILDLHFDPQARRVVIAPSTLHWNQGQATIVGSISAADGANGRTIWALDVKSTEGVLAGEEFGVPNVAIEEATVQGTLSPDTGRIDLTLARLRAGGAQVEAAGELVLSQPQPSLRIEGRIGPATAEIAKAIWPRILGPGARRWVGRHVTKGRLNSGNFKVALTGGKGAVAPDNRRISLTIDASDVAFTPGKSLVPVDVPRALLRIEGDSLEISMPDASSTIGGNRRVAMKAGRFTAVAIYDEPTLGEIAFRFQSQLPAAVDYLEQDSLGIGPLGLPAEGLDGKVEGNLKINLPLVTGVALADMKIEGKAKVTDGKAKQIIGNHDIQGATVNIDVGEGAINGSGQMLIGGVTAKLAFQRFLGGADDKQPPVRLTANLDASDRNQLGLDINHLVSGEIPIDLSLTRTSRSEQQVRVRADLSGVELNIEPLAWRKAPGRQALLEFDLARGQKNRTELQNFKVVGDDIAIDGNMAVDGKGRFVEFQFPNFALTLVSRLELHGHLRPDNVWDVKARGGYWDGREFFRQMFAVGQAPERASTPKKDQPGVDLKAEIDNILGHGDISLKGLRLQMSRRGQKVVGLLARANVEGGKPIEAGMQQTANEPRKLVVLTDDAGQAFRMVGFYPNMQGGSMRLDINLDGKGAAEKTGLLDVRNFRILGDAVVSEVLQTPDEARTSAEAGQRPKRKMERQTIEFNLMQAPFSVGYNQFVLDDAQLRGPLVGARLRGKADFETQFVDIGGSYIPLQGINSALGEVPALGQLFAGQKGEGVLGITFRIAGPMAQPQVQVNPLSIVLPGVFRGLGEMAPATYRIVPRHTKPAEPSKVRLPQAPAGGDPIRHPAAKAPRASTPEVTSGWSTTMGGGKN